jgi:hypothetical protein
MNDVFDDDVQAGGRVALVTGQVIAVDGGEAAMLPVPWRPAAGPARA